LHARQLNDATDPKDITVAIDSLVEKLQNRRPSYDEFLPYFKDLQSSEMFGSRKKLVQYILAKMAGHFMKDAPLDRDVMTIEHLAPQGGEKGGIDDWAVAEIGNLLWVPESVQKALGTKDVKAKIAMLRKNGAVWLDETLDDLIGEWGFDAISRRTEVLAKLAYEKVWAIR
jgi:hypothetical protein